MIDIALYSIEREREGKGKGGINKEVDIAPYSIERERDKEKEGDPKKRKPELTRSDQRLAKILAIDFLTTYDKTENPG